MVENEIKKLSPHDLEKIIAKAISDTLGQTYEASIRTIDYGHETHTGAAIQVSLTKASPLNTPRRRTDTADAAPGD